MHQLQEIDTALTESAIPSLIHNDLNLDNILVAEKQPYFVDWTDAGLGGAMSDLSELAMYLPEASHESIFKAYFGEALDQVQLSRFQLYYFLRHMLFAVWGVEQAILKGVSVDQSFTDNIKTHSVLKPIQFIQAFYQGDFTFDDPSNFLVFAQIYFNEAFRLSESWKDIEEIKRLLNSVSDF